MIMKQVLLLLIFTFGFVKGDMYMHALRGSNNRLDEANRERNNANRLYDSQNNNRGGYNVGKINVYESETVPITWTNQHGCNSNDTKHCQVIVQMMCDPLLRDGTTTERIPTNPAQCRNFNCDLDVRYGRHESTAFYRTCEQTERNKGLFLASQKLNQDRATRTRQNPGGTRRGLECPEERDYYPYWRPTPWKDIVIFTKDIEACQEIADQSENVVGRWYCELPEGAELTGNQRIPIEKAKCEEMEFTMDGGNSTNAKWIQAAAHGWAKPACVSAEATRPNHLGLIGHKKQWSYDWKVPETILGSSQEMTCAMRYRYNITQDYDGFLKNAETGAFDTLNPGEVTAQYNSEAGGNAQNSPATLPIWEKYGLEFEDVKCSFRNQADCPNGDEDSREYVLVNNPQVGILGAGFEQIKLQLAVNTAQYGRTFQDRSHSFTLHKRPAEMASQQNLKLLTVGGKRGNIVQTFPGHEYFFYPETIHLKQGDFVHLEISGSDTNPNNNDGQGRKGTDRSNICPLKNSNYVGGETSDDPNSHGAAGNNYPAYVVDPAAYAIPQIYKGTPRVTARDENGDPTATEEVKCREPDHYMEPIGGMDAEIAAQICTGRVQGKTNTDYGNMEELDDAGTALTFEPIQVTKVGCWNYLSTRNNNFSNRSQKGRLCVDRGEFASSDVGYNGAAMMTDDGWLQIPTAALNTIYSITFETTPGAEGAASPTITVNPPNLAFEDGKSAELGIDYSHRALRTPKVMHQAHDSTEWNEITDVDYVERDGKTVALFQITESGHYKVEDALHIGAVAAIVVIGIVFLCVLCTLMYVKIFRKPDSTDNFNSSLQQT